MTINDWLSIAMLAILLLFLFSGLPVFIVLAGTGILFSGVALLADRYWGAATGIDNLTMNLLLDRLFEMISNETLVSLPLFILMGLMLDRSGVIKKLWNSMQELLGTLRGGLALAVVAVGMLLAAATATLGGSVMLLGMLSLPAMIKQNYPKELAVGAVCSAGHLGTLFPPSIMLVLMADQLALSVGDLFMGAVFPGLTLAACYIIPITIYALFTDRLVDSGHRGPSWSALWGILKATVPLLLLILAVLGSIFGGFTTPTEASGVGALGAILLAWAYGKLDGQVLTRVFQGTTRTSGLIFAIFMGTSYFLLVFRVLGGGEFVEEFLGGIPIGAHGVLLCVLALIFLLGFFLDWIAMALIVFPLLVPVVRQLDFAVEGYGVLDEPILLWFALLAAMVLQTSFLTPPVGAALLQLKRIAPEGVATGHIYRGVALFVFLQLLAVGVAILFPRVVTWLPSMVYY